LAIGEISNRWLNNLDNGLDIFGEKTNFVKPLQWFTYTQETSDWLAAASEYDSWLQTYFSINATISVKTSITQEALVNTEDQIMILSAQLQQTQTSLLSIGEEILTVRDEEVKLYAQVSSALQLAQVHLLEATTQALQDLREAQTRAQRSDALLVIIASLNQLNGWVQIVGLPTLPYVWVEGASGQNQTSTGNITDVIFYVLDLFTDLDIQTKECCREQEELLLQLKTTQQVFIDLSNFLLNLEQLDYLLRSNNRLSLPDILPQLVIVQYQAAQLGSYVDLFLNYFKILNSEGLTIALEVKGLAFLTQTHTQLILDWYQQLMNYQQLQIQIQILQTQTTYLSNLFQQDQFQSYAVGQAASLIQLKRSIVVIQIVRLLYTQVRQFQFLSLQTIPTFSLPTNPTTTELLELQASIRTQVSIYEEQAAQNIATVCASTFTVTRSDSPNQFQNLQTGTKATFQVPLPTDTSSTNFVAVRLKQPKFFLGFSNFTKARVADVVHVRAVHIGQSSFLRADGQVISFTHPDISYRFFYNSQNNCSTSANEENQDFISYSPYGMWTITIDPGQIGNLSQLNSVTFVFEVSFQDRGITNSVTSMFGSQSTGICIAPQNCPS